MKKIIFVITALLLLGFVLPQTTFGIGQMIEPIIIKDVLRNSEVTDTLVLFNSGDEEVVYQIKAEGEIADWASFYQIGDTNLENPIAEVQISAKSRLKATVKFTIPEDAPNGEYTGEVAIVTVPTKSEEGGEMTINILQRIGREVLITITDEEILKFKTTIIPLKYGMGKDDPLGIKVIHANQGNVLVEPDIQLKIIKSGKTVFNAIFPYPEDEKPVRPMERKVMSSLIKWQTAGQEDGEYEAEVKVLLAGKIMHENDFGFRVGAEADNINKYLSFIFRIGGGNLVFGWLMTGGFLMIMSMLFISVGRKRGFLKARKKKRK